jgi:hypothetical protein
MEASDRVLLIAVDDSEDSQKAFMWAVDNMYREGDQIHLVHVVPRLAFAAQYGVPPVDFVPAAENSSYESAVQRAEQFIIDRFVRALPVTIKAPVVHIIKVSVNFYRILTPFLPLLTLVLCRCAAAVHLLFTRMLACCAAAPTLAASFHSSRMHTAHRCC